MAEHKPHVRQENRRARRQRRAAERAAFRAEAAAHGGTVTFFNERRGAFVAKGAP